MVMRPFKVSTVLGAALLLWGALLALTSSPAHAAGSCSTTDGTTTGAESRSPERAGEVRAGGEE